jgi:anti-anti-sigma regulatory factor
MFSLSVEKVDRVAIVHCEGRIVQSDAAYRLRNAVTGQRDARIILLDLAGVNALEGGGLGMLLFLHVWTREHDIQLKVMDPIARVRQSLERMRSTAAVKIAGIGEALSLLGWGPEELWDSSRMAA